MNIQKVLFSFKYKPINQLNFKNKNSKRGIGNFIKTDITSNKNAFLETIS